MCLLPGKQSVCNMLSAMETRLFFPQAYEKFRGKNKSLSLRTRGKTIRRELRRRGNTKSQFLWKQFILSKLMGLYIEAVGHTFSLKGLWGSVWYIGKRLCYHHAEPRVSGTRAHRCVALWATHSFLYLSSSPRVGFIPDKELPVASLDFLFLSNFSLSGFGLWSGSGG